ncbi:MULTISPECIES: tryptophan--tRNA ligase [Thalassolituus]|jgi:tryptophanyl-tRNA synthetase|uniref:Tryptophan--tRNA ligase n=1 Tax=Thalassolituus maritimus TaxID=484498 RepID=A0A1N7N2E5_9GAMM|nr:MULTISPECIES: tryptophan--tRNA ligase [Thalassolituus]KZY99604.1 tryptophan--tRNA ligase [Oleibacter sp. HI0075]MAX87407.1 tryptophan--tRNA ligase [Oceanospirillaceae bacterium]MEE3190157.1 tryptophan--tRNA ligase [Pseudomonadota bacterium]HCG79809.1 tryptophan--tRNA ligase [Oceanospirillales bacterium]MBN59299.1 tryptophan--tRNA ligase [Oceanospirillaceae bacterium]|tara:strand:- start:215 stop:1231 length:1017 start_codon:yes stop_codon:yes gene_type:complete
MSKQRVLTGITTTGTPHLGNYVGAIRPAIEASRDTNNESFYFLADFHALIKCQDPAAVHQSTKEIAATWLALGLDTDNAVFYRQSDIPEIPELTWVLNCVCAKGLMNRAHAYKAAVDANVEEGEDADKAITMGLFSYPVLMAADILMFGSNKVPVGKDQIQHVEMARDMAQRFNHIYCKKEPLLTLPDYQVDEDSAILQGLDGRKMSKSYGNTIPLFLPEKKLQKHINKIKTNLLEPGEPKDPDTSAVFQIWKAFATQEQTAEMRRAFEEGIGWGDAKKKLFALINEEIAEARERYEDLLARPADIEAELQKGAEKARAVSKPMLAQVREAIGISGLK